MSRNTPRFFRATCGLMICSALIVGCLGPGMYYGTPYNQPMYAPPQSLSPGAPGTLYIPESNQQYAPGSTYDSDPKDDFNRPGDNGQFFQPDDPVPQPRDPNQDRFRDDLGGQTSTQLDLPTNSMAARPEIQQVSATTTIPEYGFDTRNYSWLRGAMSHDLNNGGWSVTYSLAGDDRYYGRLPLSGISPSVLQQFPAGSFVDVEGHVDVDSATGQPTYHVTAIRPMAIQNAQ